MPPYRAWFPKGTQAQIASRDVLKEFQRSWKWHHPLEELQLGFADQFAAVRDIGYYHGGDTLYWFESVPGTWHECCLVPPPRVKTVKALFDELKALPWPSIAGSVADFALYESLLAGFAERVVKGDLVDLSKLPVPDAGTLGHVERLRARSDLSTDDKNFLNYFDVTERLRSAVSSATSDTD